MSNVRLDPLRPAFKQQVEQAGLLFSEITA